MSYVNIKTLASMTAFSLLLFVLCAAPAQSVEVAKNLVDVTLRIGFTQSCFTGVNQNDARAAFKVFILTVGRSHGYRVQSRVTVYDDDTLFEKAIREKAINLVIVNSWEYLEMNVGNYVKPTFVTLDQGRFGNSYVILSRRDGQVNSLTELRGRNIIRLQSANATTGSFWFKALLQAKNFGTVDSFLGGLEVVSKPSAAILPVFFGKKDACLVTQSSFDVMSELNPQLGRNLQKLVASEIFADVIICLSHDDWTSKSNREDLVKALGDLHLEASGQQILSLFKITRLIPFEEHHLDSVRNLRNLYAKDSIGKNR